MTACSVSDSGYCSVFTIRDKFERHSKAPWQSWGRSEYKGFNTKQAAHRELNLYLKNKA